MRVPELEELVLHADEQDAPLVRDGAVVDEFAFAVRVPGEEVEGEFGEVGGGEHVVLALVEAFGVAFDAEVFAEGGGGGGGEEEEREEGGEMWEIHVWGFWRWVGGGDGRLNWDVLVDFGIMEVEVDGLDCYSHLLGICY